MTKDSTDLENLLQRDSSKLIIQTTSVYQKLSFLKALKDNLLCLGYLQQTIETIKTLNDHTSNYELMKHEHDELNQLRYLNRHKNRNVDSYLLEKNTLNMGFDNDSEDHLQISNDSYINQERRNIINEYKIADDLLMIPENVHFSSPPPQKHSNVFTTVDSKIQKNSSTHEGN